MTAKLTNPTHQSCAEMEKVQTAVLIRHPSPVLIPCPFFCPAVLIPHPPVLLFSFLIPSPVLLFSFLILSPALLFSFLILSPVLLPMQIPHPPHPLLPARTTRGLAWLLA